MPINSSNNNKILPANARAVDVARATLDAVLPVQARRYHAAFMVQGYNGILYTQKASGLACACKRPQQVMASRLSADGKATPSDINALITGNDNFGVLPYASQRARARPDLVDDGTGKLVEQPRRNLPSMYEADDPNFDLGVKPQYSFQDHYSKDDRDARAGVRVASGAGPNGPVAADDDLEAMFDRISNDMPFMSMSDLSCPVCFGTGFVGGYDAYRAYRYVASVATTTCTFDASSEIDFTHEIPDVVTQTVTMTNVLLPKYVVSVDALRAFNLTNILPCLIYVDNIRILHENELLSLCDGLSNHTIRVEFSSPVAFTHFELQINQSRDEPFFEFPRLNKTSTQTLLENTAPFSINLSPSIPQLAPKDVITESSFGKALQVTSCNLWNDKARHVLGWDCEVRPVQPAELINLLPRRPQIQAQRSITHVRDNSFGHRRV